MTGAIMGAAPLLLLYTQFGIYISRWSEFEMVAGMIQDGSSCFVYPKGNDEYIPKKKQAIRRSVHPWMKSNYL